MSLINIGLDVLQDQEVNQDKEDTDHIKVGVTQAFLLLLLGQEKTTHKNLVRTAAND